MKGTRALLGKGRERWKLLKGPACGTEAGEGELKRKKSILPGGCLQLLSNSSWLLCVYPVELKADGLALATIEAVPPCPASTIPG
jgi:hypothetical protein